MKLTHRDKEILAHGYHRASIPVSELAALVGSRPHTTRRCIQRFTDEQLTARKAFIDVYRLGYTQYELFYSIAAASRHAASTFVSLLCSSQKVAWVGEFSGEFQFVATVCCKSPQEALGFLNTTTSHPKISVVKRQVAVRVGYTEFPLLLLSEKVRKDESLFFGVPGVVMIDHKDHLLLSSLSKDSSTSTRELAQQLGMSQSSVIQRMRRLEQEKVIVGYTYVIDFSKLGLQAFAILLQTKAHTEQLTKSLLSFAARHRYIIYCAEALGAYDYKFGILLDKPAEIISLAQELNENFAHEISSLTTLTAFDYRKVARYPF